MTKRLFIVKYVFFNNNFDVTRNNANKTIKNVENEINDEINDEVDNNFENIYDDVLNTTKNVNNTNEANEVNFFV